uniref:Pentatricopeptide repeat-containing protein n=1 Tax=Musa acuminata subsp. malaccensis TaxID=214687 RepID=A0A804KTP9_MUSAM
MPSCRVLSSSAIHPRDLPLLQCLSRRDLRAARRVLDDSAHHPGAVVRWTSAISRFASAGFLPEAVALFDLMPRRNLVTWNALLAAYLHAGCTSAALDLFARMPGRNVVSYTSALCALARAGRIDDARALFDALPERNVVSYNAMLTALARSGDLAGARRLFDEMPERNAASWNSLIAGYAERGHMAEARSLFDEMVRCGSANVVSWTAVIAGYARAGDVWEAYDLFQMMIPDPNVVTWTAMMGGFAWNGFHHEAVSLFLDMSRTADRLEPNGETLLSLIYACAGMGFPCLGKQAHAYALVHGMDGNGEDARLTKGFIYMYSRFGYMDWARHIFDRSIRRCDAVCWNSMIEGYIRIGRLEEARRLFERMPERDATAWTVVISGLVRNERVAEAFGAFAESRAAGFAPEGHALAALLGAVGSVARLEVGEQVHGLTVKTGPASDTVLRNALVAMYAKSGDLEGARKVFEEEAAGKGGGWRDAVTWNTMVMGLAHHGRAHEALRLVVEMKQEVEPDGGTCLGALMACDHVGMVERAEEVIRFMVDRGIAVRAEHYACVVDMLGRAGRFEAAERFAGSAQAAAAAGGGGGVGRVAGHVRNGEGRRRGDGGGGAGGADGAGDGPEECGGPRGFVPRLRQEREPQGRSGGAGGDGEEGGEEEARL